MEQLPRLVHILFVGGGRGCYDILQLLTSYSLKILRPEIIGVIDPDHQARGRTLAQELGIPTADHFSDAMKDPRLDLIIELTGSDEVLKQLYLGKRREVKVIDHLGALFLWEIIDIQKKHIDLEQKVRDLDTMAAMGEMAYRLTHELRNPLMIFGGLVRRIMTRPDLDHGVRKRLKRAAAQVQTMEEVISDICDVVQPLYPRKQPTDMSRFLDQWYEEISIEARLMGVSVDAEIEDDLPTMLVDPSLLRQALFHLLENSLDALTESGGHITIAAKLCWDDLLILFSDSGSGMEKLSPNRAMQPFASTKEGHMGLGLSLCRQIIYDHNGSIELREREKGGTMVIIELPVVFAGMEPSTQS
jgi:signal transduction histidine kinase